MRTLINLDKIGTKYHHEQISKSFVKNMIMFLFMQAAQSNGSMTDMTGAGRTILVNDGGANMNLRPVTQGDNSGGGIWKGMLPHESYGIRLGTGNTPVTPDDYTILDTLIPHTTMAPEGAAEVKMAYDYLQAYSNEDRLYGSTWIGQTFHVPEAISATGARMRFYRIGDVSGKTLTMSLRRTYGSMTDMATADLAVGTRALTNLDPAETAYWGRFLEVTFNTPVTLHPNYQYALIARSDCINSSNCICHPRPSMGSYRQPDHCGLDNRIDSGNAGVSWSTDASYRYSRGYHLLGKTPVGLCYSGSVVGPVTVSGSTAQFVIEALFSNYSGSTVTIKEVALISSAWDSVNPKKTTPVVLARDVLGSPVDVLNGEILRVRYIPQITV